VVETEPKYDLPLDFPALPALSREECRDVLSGISYGKALSSDLMSDIIFHRNLRQKASMVFRDLWSDNLNRKEYGRHFEARLIALNKDHPKIPRYDRFRPIVVASPLVKLLEARFAGKLRTYLMDDMFPGQVGFVPDCSVVLNIVRAVNLIQRYTCDHKVHCFGLFIDFSNAYNMVQHGKLFKRLHGILSEQEIHFLRAIYSRNVIRMGKHSFKPNVGVAQGSIISPYLFDIYIEDLFKEIVSIRRLVPMENVLAYADDVLIICTGVRTLKAIIEAIEHWSAFNGMRLNKSKSAVVEFLPRHARCRNIKAQSVSGIPVEMRYKYLGLWLNQKLNLDDQMEHIRKKADFIRVKLNPVLAGCSLDYRKNLWETFVRPLFEFTLPLHVKESAETRKDELRRLVKYTFKRFTKISRTAPDSIVNRLCGYDIDQRGTSVVRAQEEMWELRSSRWRGKKLESSLEVDEAEVGSLHSTGKREPANYCKWISSNGVEYVNLFTKLCPKCNVKSIMSQRHLLNVHNLEFQEPPDLFGTLQKEQSEQLEGTRTAKLFLAHERIRQEIERLKQFIYS